MLNDTFEQFVKERIFLMGVAPKTVEFYRRGWVTFRKHYQGEEITKEILKDFMIKIRESGIKATTANTYARAINAFLNWMHEQNHLPERLAIKKIKEEQSVRKSPTDEAVTAIIRFKPKAKERRIHTILMLLIDTGMRIDEALGCLTQNVDLNKCLITIKGKGQKERIVPISLEMRKILWLYTTRHRGSNPSPYLFPTRSYGRMEYHNFRRALLSLCKKTGITIRMNAHGFRHYFSINFIKRGGDLYRLSRILGHEDIKTTEIYLKSMGIETVQEIHQQLSPLSRLR
jgi:site-specific recombinase XerD